MLLLGLLTGSNATEVVTPTPLKSPAPNLKEPMPEAPPDGILDAAQAFTPEQRKDLSQKLLAFRKSHEFQIYIATYTFVYGEDANQRADRLGNKWLKKQQGAVIVFDKGGKGAAPSLGMAWQDEDIGVPQPTILGMFLGVKSTFEAKPINRPNEGLIAAADELMAGYARIRPIIETSRRNDRINQLKILGGVIGVMLLSLMVITFAQRFQRKMEKRDAESYLFPHVEIAPRYGAPYGGGVVVQMHYGPPNPPPSA